MWWCKMLYDEVPAMWGILDDKIYISIERGIKERMHEGEEGSKLGFHRA